MAADAIRDELGQQFPDIDALNKEYSVWKNTQQVIDATVLRRVGQAKPLGRKLASAAGTVGGFATGGVGGAVLGRETMDLLEKVTTSTGWGTVSAVTKNNLANAIAAGDATATLKILNGIAQEKTTETESPAPPYAQATAEKQ